MSRAFKHLVSAIVLAVISYGLVFIQFTIIDRLNEKASADSTRVASAKADREAAMSLVDRLDQAGGLDAILRAAFVPKDDLVPFIEVLESTARAKGLVPEVVAANDAAGTAERPLLSATIVVKGSRMAVDGYVRSLEELPYHVIVDAVGVAHADDGRWIGTVAVSAFVLPESLKEEVYMTNETKR